MYETGHLKVAMTTDNLLQVDADFISARQIVFYDVSRDTSEFVDAVQFAGGGANKGEKPAGTGKNGGCCWAVADEGKPGDRIGTMVGALAGSSVLFTLGLSDPQAVRVRDAGVFPVKMERIREITEVIERLQFMLGDNPPLWMVRALKGTGQNRVLFAGQES